MPHNSGEPAINVVKVEISPTPTLKAWHRYQDWKLIFDQDQFPEWHNPLTSEKRARTALRERAKIGFTTVDARGCTGLTELKADKAEYVDASGCLKLKR